MIDVRAVTDQKIAVGAVENPACHRLRVAAAVVPADQAIVEIGAFRGRSTGWLALGASEGHGAHVTSVDPWETRPLDSWPEGYFDKQVLSSYSDPGVRAAYDAHLAECGITGLVTPVQGFGEAVGKAWDGPKVGLLFHDGEHTAEAVARDLRAWLPHMADSAVVILHDAGNPAFGVVEGARRVFARRKGWQWDARELQLWPKNPDRRGILIVRKR